MLSVRNSHDDAIQKHRPATLDRILCRAELSVCFNVKHFCCIMIGDNLTRVFPLYLRSDYLKFVLRQGTFMYSYVFGYFNIYNIVLTQARICIHLCIVGKQFDLHLNCV